MIASARERRALHEALERVIGQEASETLLDHLPPAGWADLVTKQDVAALRVELKGDVAALRNELKGDVAELRAELKGDVAELRAELKGDIATLREQVGAVEHRILAAVRGEIVGAINTQTKTILFATIGMGVTFGGFTLAAAGLR